VTDRLDAWEKVWKHNLELKAEVERLRGAPLRQQADRLMQEVSALTEQLQKVNTIQDQTYHLNIELQEKSERLRGEVAAEREVRQIVARVSDQQDTTIATLRSQLEYHHTTCPGNLSAGLKGMQERDATIAKLQGENIEQDKEIQEYESTVIAYEKTIATLREAFQQRIDNAQASIEEGHHLDWSAQKVEALLNGLREALAATKAPQ